MESNFYSRVGLLPEFSTEVFKRFGATKVLVIGVGGLGCPVLLGLNSVGFGEIGIMDGDTIDASNLSRQILFSPLDIGSSKADMAATKLNQSGSKTTYVPVSEYITVQNACSRIREYDIVIDCTDNFFARYLINDACFLEKKVLVYGAVHRYEGTVSVFHYKNGPTLRCLYPILPLTDEIKGCNENGILPTVTNIIGSVMANEAIKIVGGFGDVLSGKLFSINLDSLHFDTISFKKGDFSVYPTEILPSNYSKQDCDVISDGEITVEALAEWKRGRKSFQLLDVRTKKEYVLCNLEGMNIPLDQLEANIGQISNELPVVVVCHHGGRSARAISTLKNQGFKGEMYNLVGGIHAWAEKIDPKMPKY